MSNTGPIDRSQLMDALQHMLEILSSAPLKKQYCERCGLLMSHVSARCWIDGGEQTWAIPLPYCIHCDSEVANQPGFAA